MTHGTHEQEQITPIDPGLSALVMLLHLMGVGADAQQLHHRFGGGAFGVSEMLRCAKDLGLKARNVRTKWPRLASTPLTGHRGAARRRLSVARQGGRRQGDRSVAVVATAGLDDAG